ncbi:MAG: hypothetical protein ACHBNF_19585 [Chromatiales bacterium]
MRMPLYLFVCIAPPLTSVPRSEAPAFLLQAVALFLEPLALVIDVPLLVVIGIILTAPLLRRRAGDRAHDGPGRRTPPSADQSAEQCSAERAPEQPGLCGLGSSLQ